MLSKEEKAKQSSENENVENESKDIEEELEYSFEMGV